MLANILSLISSLFDRIIILSIEASILIVLILLVQYMCKRQLGIHWQYALWFVVVAKLSLLWIPNRLIARFEWLLWPDQLHITSLVEASTPNLNIPWIHTLAGESMNTNGAAHVVTESNSMLLSWTSVVIMIWLLGVVLLLSRIWIIHLKEASLLRNEIVPKIPNEFMLLFDQMKVKLRVKRNLSIRQTNLVNSPSLFGLFNPVVLIPTYMLQHISEEEFTFVITHELSHYKRQDILINIWCSLLNTIYWFNPIIWYGLYRMRIDQEMSCDAETVQHIGYEQKSKYATAIVRLIELGSSTRMLSTQIGLFGYRSQMKRRIIMIKSLNRMKYRSSVIGVLSALLLVAITMPQSQIGQAHVNESLAMVNPTDGRVTTHFGLLNKGSDGTKKEFHDGIDIQNREGTPIKAVAAGTIIAAEYAPIHGNTVTIRHNEGWLTRYDHLQQIDLEVGTEIEQGQQIGNMGITGASTGPHLHFSIMINGEYVDPENLLISEI